MNRHRQTIRNAHLASEKSAIKSLLSRANLSQDERQAITEKAVNLVRQIRSSSTPSMMENFLGEYGLSTQEGIALMCLAEALLRVPDTATIDALIEDKIRPYDWNSHLGHSNSPLVNASTWALLLTGKVLDDNTSIFNTLSGLLKRVGEPVIRTAVGRAMQEMGRQFVLGTSIDNAATRANAMQAKGYTYSYDMLGEAAKTEADARRYHLSYSDAISRLAKQCNHADTLKNPGISVKLSALHPRYETLQHRRVMEELLPRLRALATLAKSANMGFNIDAEESERLDLSLDIIHALIEGPELADWDGLGVVIQAYGPRCPHVIDWLYDRANATDRKFMVRLVKGAYWDREIKRGQTLGLDGFPVFTRKPTTDLSYIACAKQLLGMTDRLYPQFATHNAHTAAAILQLAGPVSHFEFQRLHGMGEALHQQIMDQHGTRCRIYAPVGAHKDLLAYLVRRLLENGANSSFVNQIVDPEIPATQVAADPVAQVEVYADNPHNPNIDRPDAVFQPARASAKGWDINDPVTLHALKESYSNPVNQIAKCGPLTALPCKPQEYREAENPATGQTIGKVYEANEHCVEMALAGATSWKEASPEHRTNCLLRAADLFERHAEDFFIEATREAGKTLADAVDEVREAVDFIRYYAGQVNTLNQAEPIGLVAAISPWNFPLAIFTGQIAGALAAGNGVIAKPAEATPLIAYRAVKLLHEAGVPKSVLQYLPGEGKTVGASLCADPRIAGVCFTGSLPTAKLIEKTMAENLVPHAPLIAETGGINAMIVDSSALPEQAVTDIIASAFQSAGQRCSALRILCLQEDIADTVLLMLMGAMDELSLGDPSQFNIDIGPLIDATAQKNAQDHIDRAAQQGRLLKQVPTPGSGYFAGPAVIKVDNVLDVGSEIFAPVLHICTYASEHLEGLIGKINSMGYGLTFGMHSRIDDRIDRAAKTIKCGNLYINRNQIGAIVGSQPFGGEGLSGTGPKAGGPRYVHRMTISQAQIDLESNSHSATQPPSANTNVSLETLNQAISESQTPDTTKTLSVENLPGPTGESNIYSTHPRGRILCLGPGEQALALQVKQVEKMGCVAIAVQQNQRSVDPELLTHCDSIDGVVYWGDSHTAKQIRCALASRSGAIIPLILDHDFENRLIVERHLCIDTTAAGGNASLLGV